MLTGVFLYEKHDNPKKKYVSQKFAKFNPRKILKNGQFAKINTRENLPAKMCARENVFLLSYSKCHQNASWIPIGSTCFKEIRAFEECFTPAYNKLKEEPENAALLNFQIDEDGGSGKFGLNLSDITNHDSQNLKMGDQKQTESTDQMP